ncbi:protein kinase [bacterium]|nr:protein kinase [bacterium]
MVLNCPTENALRLYLIGDYSDEEGAQIEEHLSQCAACEDTLARFDDTKDILLRHLPMAAAATDEAELPNSFSRPAWLDRLKAGLPAKSIEQTDSLSDDFVVEQASNPISGLESYKLLGILGRGGMGVVYRGRHRQLGREVAIKIVHPKLTSALSARDRFEQEIRILGGMNHPGIVMATDAGRVGPAAYLVMELIEGIDLARLVRKHGPLSISQATEITRQIAEALAAAHAGNAIHRDVKPSNVMLDRSGQAKLLDFGLAHLSERAHKHHETSLGHVLGTLDYMAPEQAEGKSVASSTDLYGLGALLFYLLTGDPPHGNSPDRTLLQQLKSITTADARSLSSVRVDVPDELNELVAKLLTRDPSLRSADAKQVAQSLSSWADADSIASLTEEIEPSLPVEPDEIDLSLSKLLGVEVDQSPPAKTPGGLRMFRNYGIVALIAAGVAAAWFGITVLLDTPTGKIQINSEVAGVQVELLDESDRPTKLTVESKEKTTELKVGKYRVRILGSHDGITLDKETLTLTKGKTVVATIRQIANPSNDEPLGKPLLPGTVSDEYEPVWNGHPRSFWVELFEIEKNPVAKITAGEALLSFVSGSPEEQVEQRVGILGSLLKAVYGSQLEDMVLANCNNNFRFQVSLIKSGIAVEKASQSGKQETPEQAMRRCWMNQLNHLNQLPSEQVAEKLIEMVSDESPQKSAYALTVLSHFVQGLVGQPKDFSEAVIDDLKIDAAPTAKLREGCLLLRSAVFRFANSDQKKRLVEDMERAGRESVELDIASLSPTATASQALAAKRDRTFERAWLTRVQRWKKYGVATGSNKYVVKGVDQKLIAQVALYDVINNEYAFKIYFPSDWTTEIKPFARLSDYRDKAFPIWEEWVSVANEWLAKNDTPENRTKVNRVLVTYRRVLPARLEDDDWDVKETARLMKKHLRARYESDETPTSGLGADELLTNIILCGESFPDFVLSEPPADPAIRKRLANLAAVVDSDLPYDQYLRGIVAAKGLIQVAPYHTVKHILTATKFPKYDNGHRVALLRIISEASNVETRVTFGASTKYRPPINPLLLLAIASQLTDEVGNSIDYRGLESNQELFRRHLSSALQCPTMVGAIAQRWYEQMYEKASDLKKEEIKKLKSGR